MATVGGLVVTFVSARALTVVSGAEEATGTLAVTLVALVDTLAALGILALTVALAGALVDTLVEAIP